MEKLRGEPQAVLMHVYGFEAKTIRQKNTEGKVVGTREIIRPNKRARLSIAALRELSKQGAENFVISGGKISGEDFPEVGQVTAEEFIRKTHIDTKRVIITTTAPEPEDHTKTKEVKDTSREIDAFTDVADKNSWENIATLANRTHTLSIRRLLRKKSIKADVLSTEIILTTLPSERNRKRYEKIIKGMNWSLDGIKFIGYETVKNIILLVPGGMEFLRNKADRMKRKSNI